MNKDWETKALDNLSIQDLKRLEQGGRLAFSDEV